jgi:hypothetical protein
MAGPKSKQTIEIDQRRRILKEAYEVSATLAAVRYALDDLLHYAKPITKFCEGWCARTDADKYGSDLPNTPLSPSEILFVADAFISYLAAVHRAEKVAKPLQV